MAIVKETRFITSGTTWVVPNNWNNANNSVTCIGGGAGGAGSPSLRGGGGGARASNTNVTLTSGSTINVAVGAGGSPDTSGGYTAFNILTAPSITLIGSNAASSTSTVGLPSGLLEGDMVISVTLEDVGTPTTPTGFTSLGLNTGGAPSYQYSYKFMGATPDTEVTGLRSDTDTGHVVFVLRGVNPNNPFSGTGSVASGATGLPDPPAITTEYNNTMVLAIGLLDDDQDTGISPPTNYTTINNFSFGSAESGGTIMTAYRIISGITSENPGAFTGTGNDANHGIVLGINPLISASVLAAGGNITTGGQAANSIGQTVYSGGNGGTSDPGGNGGGGGAGGNTANGSNGGIANGGNGGATDGGDGGTGFSIAAGNPGYSGWDNGSSSAALGSNYAGGGGGSSGFITDKSGTTNYDAGDGGLFGGGGGGTSSSSSFAGTGAQGVIIVEWTYQSIANSSGQISISDVNLILGDAASNTSSLNDSDVRSVANTSSGQISFTNFYDGYETPTFVGSNTGSVASGTIGSPWSLPAETQTGDIAMLFISNRSTSPILQNSGNAPYYENPWTYMGETYGSVVYASTNYARGFWKVITDPSEELPYCPTTAVNATWQLLVFRGASKVTAVQEVNSDTGSTLDFTGITKSSASKMLVSYVVDRDSGSIITVPTNWTFITRQTSTEAASETAYLDSRLYTNSSTISWGSFTITNSQAGILVELE